MRSHMKEEDKTGIVRLSSKMSIASEAAPTSPARATSIFKESVDVSGCHIISSGRLYCEKFGIK